MFNVYKLAQGVDKLRNCREPAIFIWDVTRSSGSRVHDIKETKMTMPSEESNSHSFTLPLVSIGLEGETINPLFDNTLTSIYDFKNIRPESAQTITTCDKALCELGKINYMYLYVFYLLLVTYIQLLIFWKVYLVLEIISLMIGFIMCNL